MANSSNRYGRLYSQMITLQINIIKGCSCHVCTKNPEGFKARFKLVTDKEISLTKTKDSIDVYKAELV